MLTDAVQTVDFELLDDALRLAPALFPQLFRKITEVAPGLRRSGNQERRLGSIA